MSTTPGNRARPEATGPGSGLPITGPGSPEPAGDHYPDVVVVPVEVPVPVPVPVVDPVRAESVAVTPPWSGTVIDPVPTSADDIAALTLAVPDVVRLHAGRFGEVATYLPGRRVTGIKLGEDLIEVHVVIAGTQPVGVTAGLIHAAVASLVATPVHVYIEDVAAA